MKRKTIALLTCVVLLCGMLSVSAVLAEGEDPATPTDVHSIYLAAIYMDGATPEYIGDLPITYSETGVPSLSVKEMEDLFALKERTIDVKRYDYNYGRTKDIAGEYLGCTLAVAEGVPMIRLPEAPQNENLYVLLVLSEAAKKEDAEKATSEPTEVPSTEVPAADPTKAPTTEVTEAPASTEPTEAPTTEVTEAPASTEPTEAPTTEVTEAPASTEPTEAPTTEVTEAPASTKPTEAPATEPAEEPATEPTVEPTEKPARAKLTVRIEIVEPKEEYYYGDEFTMRAVVENAISAVTYQWEVLLPGAEDWQAIEGAVEDTYTFVIAEENAQNQYHVKVVETEEQGE